MTPRRQLQPLKNRSREQNFGTTITEAQLQTEQLYKPDGSTTVAKQVRACATDLSRAAGRPSALHSDRRHWHTPPWQ